MDDTDLTGLDLEGARAYLVEFATAAKMLKKELEAIDGELATWVKRVALAGAKGIADLAAAAQAKVDELGAKRGGLAGELAELEAKVARIRSGLPGIAARERSIDPDRLLAELQMMAGTLLGEGGTEGAPNLEERMRELESESAADEALAALKKRDSDPPPAP